MEKVDYPATPAVRVLREKKIPFTPHLYPYQDHGGTAWAAECLGVPEHAVVKTLVMEADSRRPLIVLMHGDREVSIKELARALGVKRVAPCDANTAQKYTGYLIGGISPFGTRRAMEIYVEKSIFSLDAIYINGGKRGFLVKINPKVMEQIFPVKEVEVTI
jgi:Cys-tRNA(Pro) deacylase